MPGLFMLLLWVPGGFLAGAILMYGFPHLITIGGGLASLRHALVAGLQRPGLAVLDGLLVFSPIPGALIHVLMVLTYPPLVASALGTAVKDARGPARPRMLPAPASARRILWIIVLSAGPGSGYGCIKLWGGPGVVAWLGLAAAFALVAGYTSISWAAMLFGIAFAFLLITLGGGTLVLERWGHPALSAWIVGAVFLLLGFLAILKVHQRQPKGP